MHDPELRHAAETVPRDTFLGRAVYRPSDPPGVTVWTPARRDDVSAVEWLRLTYQNTTWVTQIDGVLAEDAAGPVTGGTGAGRMDHALRAALTKAALRMRFGGRAALARKRLGHLLALSECPNVARRLSRPPLRHGEKYADVKTVTRHRSRNRAKSTKGPKMQETAWQKSSFCGGGGNNCVEIRSGAESVHIRESERPALVLSSTRERLALLFEGVKTDRLDRLI
ncbi:DUF397 domain-containing protein [Streptomyces stramineus]|uniref:DUF397 domain-containing protein n=1 Tax=Streptomyces stramineus TaxID=173861 RepID=A0ABP3JHD6_9ACTN